MRRTIPSPIGPLRLEADGDALSAIRFDGEACEPEPSDLLDEAERQLRAYFARERTTFDLPLRPVGTDFQREVWGALTRLPYGATCSYADLATAIGRPKAVRAVGAANGRNPLPIVIPCHRVIGRDGTLVGFGGGLARKRVLLDLERDQLSLSLEASP